MRYIYLFCTLVLSRYCDNRYLHSFPTRRSSDLTGGVKHVDLQKGGCRHWQASHFGAASGRSLDRSISSNQATPVRSEEHTSELQSPCNLVCRLLLEKKKITETKDK